MTITFTETDEGKTVVDASDTTLGRVTAVGTETIAVDPELGESLRSDLGWGSGTDEEPTVHRDAVDTKSDGKIYLQGNL